MTHSSENPPNEWTDPDHSGFTDDQWHRHLGEEAPSHAHGSTATWQIFFVGLIGFGIVVASVLSISVYFTMGSQKEIAAKQEVSMNTDYKNAQAEWSKSLEGFGWANGPKGLVRVPLSIAKDKVVKEYSQGL